MPKYARSTRNEGDYRPQKQRDDKYQSFWGTPNMQDSRFTKSITIAKHPLMAWVDMMLIRARKFCPPDEIAAVQGLKEEIDSLGDFTGTRTFTVELPSIGIRGSASIIRL